MNRVKINGIYKHYKGDYYIVIDVAKSCDTLEEYVIYRALYGNSELWIRPKNDFVGEVNKNGQKYRFQLQNIKSQK